MDKQDPGFIFDISVLASGPDGGQDTERLKFPPAAASVQINTTTGLVSHVSGVPSALQHVHIDGVR